ncbi:MULTISPECIES: hypothetical protein [unclassified Faecalibacterium]|uniref:hypothetical protein n=1 Tax=unclassified Faecalibacterium TaxID=2646395 RepID=UPI001181CADC|nr:MULTISPECIES: hypothetical protein [unclassified Faecalibacterium]
MTNRTSSLVLQPGQWPAPQRQCLYCNTFCAKKIVTRRPVRRGRTFCPRASSTILLHILQVQDESSSLIFTFFSLFFALKGQFVGLSAACFLDIRPL